MTLDSLCEDCSGAFQAGQISVALDRVRQKVDLTVLNYWPGLCPPHPPTIVQFYGVSSTPLLSDLSCCSTPITATVDPPPALVECDEEVDVTSDEKDLPGTTIEFPPSTRQLPSTFDLAVFRQKLTFPKTITVMHNAINSIFKNINDDSLRDWCLFLHNGITDMAAKQSCNKLQSKHMNKIISQYLNDFPMTIDFQEHVTATFHIRDITGEHQTIVVTSILLVKDIYFSEGPLSIKQVTAGTHYSTPAQGWLKQSMLGECVWGAFCIPCLSLFAAASIMTILLWRRKRNCTSPFHATHSTL